jgi:hypothetical protein
MKKNILKLIMLFILILSAGQATFAQNLYKVTSLRAAPGELLALIANLRESVSQYKEGGGETPFIIRHSQGDQWDLMVYEHINSYQSYFGEHEQLNTIFTPHHGDDFYDLVAFHETIYTAGPDYETVAQLFENNNFFHVEMFVALPGKQKELLKQRQMENVYLTEIGRNQNQIFTVEQGGSWDCFTLGGYRDIKHFAESADIPWETEEKAAIKAGFKGVNDISPYLRSLITRHHDTLGGKVE